MSLIQNWKLSDSCGMEIPGADKKFERSEIPIVMPFNNISLFFQVSLSEINSKISFGLQSRILQRRSNV